MNWFRSHLHITWLLYMIATLFLDFVVCVLIWPRGGRITPYMWIFVTPFPINIWILRQKGRDWRWSLLTLWTLCWIPLVLRNKNCAADKKRQSARGKAKRTQKEPD